MTAEEYRRFMTPALVRDVFEDCVLNEGSERWAITVGGKVLSIQGKTFYNSREQAVRAFYNSFSWRARRALWQAAHPTDDTWGGWWREDRGVLWNTFKKSLTEDYGLNFIRV